MRTQFLFIIRHAEDCCDTAWRKANSDPNALGIPARGPEKNIRAVRAALAEYKTLIRKIYADDGLRAALKGEPISFFSSTKLRAEESAIELHTQMLDQYTTLWLEAIRYVKALDGRGYGFPWRLTERGLKQFLPKTNYDQLLLDFYTYRPHGGESWIDVVARLLRFIQEVVMNSHKHMVLMTHHELIPIIEDLLLGLVPGRLTIKSGQKELPNATAKIWVRHYDDLWRPYKTPVVTGRRGIDYSQEPDVIEQCTPPGDTASITYLEEYRELRRRHG